MRPRALLERERHQRVDDRCQVSFAFRVEPPRIQRVQPQNTEHGSHFGECGADAGPVIRDQGGTVIELHVAEDDMGKVIGRNGSVAKALRTLLKAMAAREGEPISLEIG